MSPPQSAARFYSAVSGRRFGVDVEQVLSCSRLERKNHRGVGPIRRPGPEVMG